MVCPIYEDGMMKIIVQDIFDKNKFHLEVIRDYAPVAVGRYMIIDAEFSDDTTLCLEYYSGEEWEGVM